MRIKWLIFDQEIKQEIKIKAVQPQLTNKMKENLIKRPIISNILLKSDYFFILYH